jgi:hypothetical protein
MISPWHAVALSEGGKDEGSRKAKTMKTLNNMKTKIISKTVLSLGLAVVLVSAMTQSPALGQVVTIHSTGDVTRGKTGSFVLNMDHMCYGWMGVNFSVSGTAIPGVDYAPLVSPALVQMLPCLPPNQCTITCRPGVGVIPVKTLPNLRPPFFGQDYSVVVTLKPGVGYTIGQPSSARIMINPNLQSSDTR